MTDIDVAVIGGGVAGLASALAIANRGRSVCLLERHPRLGHDTSTRNSGVIHAGIYYPQGTLKAALCVDGRERLYEFAAQHGVPHSNALVDRADQYTTGPLAGQIKNPGFPFWVAGIEHIVGQRPTTPPLDMLASAGGWDGGLPRHALDGFAAGGTALSHETPLDFSKTVTKAKPVYSSEEGTDVERTAMAFHAQKYHPSFLPTARRPRAQTRYPGSRVSAPTVPRQCPAHPFSNPVSTMTVTGLGPV